MLRKFRITINGKEYLVEMEELTSSASAPIPVQAPASVPSVQSRPSSQPSQSAPIGERVLIKAPLPGTILDIKVNVGDKVNPNQCLVILEAMKMENEIVAPKAGTVSAVHVSKGSTIDVDAPIITIV